MTRFTDRQAGLLLIACSAALGLYVLTSNWAFAEMRDGTLIGSFPMAFLALSLLFAVLIAFAKGAPAETLDDVSDVSVIGVAKISAFFAGALLLAFYHQVLGFVGICLAFLVMNALFMGQRKPVGLAIYAASVCAALFVLFTMLGFELTILPRAFGD